MKIIFRCDPNLHDYLPKPAAARSCLPDWLRQMPTTSFSEFHGRDIRTVKQCPPFVDAMTHGFMILLPCDVVVKAGKFSWDWDVPIPAAKNHPRAPLSFHVPEQILGSALAKEGSCQLAAIKFNSFWTIELEEKWSLFATHPANREDLPFRTVTGMVDCDKFHDAGINFPAIWTRPDFQGVLSKGLPVAQCFPVRREDLELVCESFDGEQIAGYDRTVGQILVEPGVYRKKFRDKRSRSPGEKRAQVRLVEE
ncbi:hypothetical protein HGP16_18730 [Rhizobium sp. P40RR-XXII]|uniref:hypothetical protein n=1 Tax=Rhizobium sp. P40RR-XXII TaxID=2726739 RepID=UPI0014574401|nr:hypothetical protein [Rhizobium sp. P40RR-XXII]NLS18594.1 hypothetical protein [Rhizobium sp. P40RR-XXII]